MFHLNVYISGLVLKLNLETFHYAHISVLCLNFLMSWQQLTHSCDRSLCAISHSFTISSLSSEMHSHVYCQLLLHKFNFEVSKLHDHGYRAACPHLRILFPLPHHSSTALKPPTPDSFQSPSPSSSRVAASC